MVKRNAGAAALAVILCVAPTMAAASTPAGLFYERTVMREADGRCHLFEPEIGAALAASSLQARGAALRAGASDGALLASADRAKTAAYSVACTSSDLATAADRVKKAFSGYARMTAMSFPGDLSTWQAERNPMAPVVNRKAVEGPRWRLSEPGLWDSLGEGSASLTFGLTSENPTPTVVTSAPGVLQAFSAFLIVRDPRKASEPYLDPRRHDLQGRVPPRNVSRSFVAQARQAAPASLLPHGQGQGALFVFPPAAAQALEGLDPREAVTVEFAYADRPNERAVFEVGDFAAGRAFVTAKR